VKAFRPRRLQSGLAAAIVVIVLILAGLAVVFGRGFFDKTIDLQRREATAANLRRVADAMVTYAALNQRLPCPADGRFESENANAGLEDGGGSLECTVGALLTGVAVPGTQTHGVVPWRTLGLAEQQAQDGWGNRLTYRVAPELVRNNAMNLTACDTAGTGGASGGFCAAGCAVATLTAGCTPPIEVVRTKGLTVEDLSGAIVAAPDVPAGQSGAAYVVISHGGNTQGAYSSRGTRQLGVPPAGTREESDNFASVAFVATTSPASPRLADGPASYAPGAGHFDDLVLRPTILEVAEAAKLGARTRITGSFAADIANVLGSTPDPSTNANTGANALDFGIFAVAAVGSSARNVSFGQGVSGTGIGSIGAGLTGNQYATINSQSDEGLYFVFDNPGRYLGITLVDFGTQSGDSERVRFWFFVGGSWTSISRTACRTGDVLANFTLNPGGNFTDVYVESRDTAMGVTTSQFLVGAITSCPDGSPSCAAPGAIAANNCPP